jgi:transposase
MLIDLERHLPIDVLEGKEAAPLTDWLEDHPAISVLARDRAEAYAQAGRIGAPDAIQVADRFHLVKNVNDALKELLRSHRWKIPENESVDEANDPEPSSEVEDLIEHEQPSPAKIALWEEVQQLKTLGYSIRAISRELGIHRKTVQRYMEARSPPAYRLGPPRPTKLMPHMKYIRQRWDEGCHSAAALLPELRRRGYDGGLTQLRKLVRPWRSDQPGKLTVQPNVSFNQWLVLRPNDHLDFDEKQDLDLVLEANPSLALGYTLREEFQRIVSQRDVEALDGWISQAALSLLKPFQSLAKGMTHDLEAIRNGIRLPWSTAQCEGQICRAKLIKRLGYGRAKLDLLRKRILHRSAAA